MAKEETRPLVLNNASETQIEELERHYADENKHEWEVLTDSYGWSKDESQAVWEWFGVDPEKKR
ncbi:MAG TPA: hypothetical protein VLQ48_09825 [Chloroflexia bacterium]|nr:hypothetical protein [Chloroflexia bacterium]